MICQYSIIHFGKIIKKHLVRGGTNMQPDMQKPLKARICLTIDEDIVAKLRQEAELCDRSLSQYINIVLKEHLKKSK